MLHASISDFIAQEIRPAILTDATITPGRSWAVANEVCTRLQAAGLVVWGDGWSESRGAYWLPSQGFRWSDTVDVDNDATFWSIVVDVLELDPAPCPDCTAHPGWATADVLQRRDPADTCRSCLGSGVLA